MNGSSLSQTQPPPTQAEAPTPTQPPLGVANPAPVAAGPDAFDPQAQFADFKTAMYDFIAAVDSVDKRLKRQLYGLEEAGIIKLRGPAGAPGGMGADPVSSLEPDGAGKIGELDVGQLNAGSSTVERDMERELWETATGHLLRVVGRNFETSGDAMALE